MKERLQQTPFGTAILAAWGVLIGVAPHALHHAGPFAGAALVAGAGGKAMFGALGLVLSIPFLLRLHRRFRTIAAPALAAAGFAALFTVSTLVVSPLILGNRDSGNRSPGLEQPAAHAAHHQKK